MRLIPYVPFRVGPLFNDSEMASHIFLCICGPEIPIKNAVWAYHQSRLVQMGVLFIIDPDAGKKPVVFFTHFLRGCTTSNDNHCHEKKNQNEQQHSDLHFRASLKLIYKDAQTRCRADAGYIKTFDWRFSKSSRLELLIFFIF